MKVTIKDIRKIYRNLQLVAYNSDTGKECSYKGYKRLKVIAGKEKYIFPRVTTKIKPFPAGCRLVGVRNGKEETIITLGDSRINPLCDEVVVSKYIALFITWNGELVFD
jgi:hypothetical protein